MLSLYPLRLHAQENLLLFTNTIKKFRHELGKVLALGTRILGIAQNHPSHDLLLFDLRLHGERKGVALLVLVSECFALPVCWYMQDQNHICLLV